MYTAVDVADWSIRNADRVCNVGTHQLKCFTIDSKLVSVVCMNL